MIHHTQSVGDPAVGLTISLTSLEKKLDSLLKFLESIINIAPHILVRIPYYPHHVLCGPPLAKLELESFLEPSDRRLALE